MLGPGNRTHKDSVSLYGQSKTTEALLLVQALGKFLEPLADAEEESIGIASTLEM